MMPTQYGAIVSVFGPIENPESAKAELRALVAERLRIERIEPSGEIEIFRHPEVSELDWCLMGGEKADWRPGVEVWGWKVFGQKKSPTNA